MNKKKIFTLGMLAVMAVFAATTVSADTKEDNQGGWQGKGGAPRMDGGPRMGGKEMGMKDGMGIKGAKPAVLGKVMSISGNTLTVASRGFGKGTGTTTYSVDATNAAVFSVNATSTLSSIAVGDNVMIQGTLSGTNVTATSIRDMKAMGRGDGKGPIAFSGNGRPVVAGKVTAVSGSTITISNESNATYTVDATNAKIMKGRDTGVIGDVTVGDHVVVQGTVSGNSVVATTILDQKAPANDNQNENDQYGAPEHKGFLRSIKGFFGKMFGF
jgi:hypothetical protein